MLSNDQFEILSKILPTLNYYQILKITKTASPQEVQEAFHKEALDLHPDRYMSLKDPALLKHARDAYARLVEAYATLSDADKRAKYDMVLSGEIPETFEDEITAVKFKKASASSAGTKFYKLAQAAFQSGNLSAAKMNIQIALNSDPQNSEFTQFLARVESQIKSKK